MRNNFGSGPASTVQVTTPNEIQISETQQPILILGTEHGIFELESLFGDSIHLFHHADNVSIESLGIHISRQLLFMSDTAGCLWRIPVEQETKNKTLLLDPSKTDFFPLDISVDWINEQLYILGEAKPRTNSGKFLIKRCNLDGTGLTVALAGLTMRPVAIEIDPCNGYLFWIQKGSNGGIFRLDISDISNGIKHEVKIEKIFSGRNLGAFIVDYTNFRLFVPDQSKSTMLQISLDGKDVKNIRESVRRPKLEKVLSLGTLNKKFYWTDGSTVFHEEYHQLLNEYFHNQVSHLGSTRYKKILINLNATQPWPIPVNPPTHLQAIFGSNLAKAKWDPPHLLGLQGRGAFQNWSYEISVQNQITGNYSVFKSNTPTVRLDNLTPNTPYILKVFAHTRSGKGPWSSEFRGMTLKEKSQPLVIWSGSEGLFKSDIAIESFETLIHKSRMQDVAFTGTAWYKDHIYMVTNNSHVYMYNLTSHRHGRLVDLDSVGSIAVDWIGKKLYWSNLKQQWIIRSNLDGSQQEPLPILTLAKEIRIDSINGYIYWSREYDVECAHLNGEDKRDYDHLEPFSGKQVMGLTLDFDNQQLYWIVRGSEGSHLFRASMIHNGNIHENFVKTKVALLQNMQGPLSYFCNRFLWLQDDRNALISDLDAKNLATINLKSVWGLNLVSVIDDSLQYIPDLNVTPHAVDKDSVRTIGSSDAFNITWDVVENVNYGTVFYEVQFDGLSNSNSTIVTSFNSVRYWKKIPAFTPVNVTIRAFTYWATAPQICTVTYSPPSTPSAPTNLRTYVTYEHNESLEGVEYFSLVFRWDPPLSPNGILQGYNVRCWFILNDESIYLCNNITKLANETEHSIVHQTYHSEYFFQVQAYTEIGTGAMSEPLGRNTHNENPLPTLLVATSDSILLYDVDINHTTILVNGINAPLAVAYLMREQKLFWINEMQELLMYHLTSLNKTKLLDLKGKPRGFTVDWLGRSLYYVEGINDTEGSVIKRVDLNSQGHFKEKEIYTTEYLVEGVEVYPFNQRLYWLERSEGVMTCGLEGSGITKHFYSCLKDIQAITMSGSSLILLDSATKKIFSSVEGDSEYNCQLVAKHPLNIGEIKNIHSDLTSFFFTTFQGVLYSLQEALLLDRVNNAVIYGKHMQPYPSRGCLSPRQDSKYIPRLAKKSFDRIILKMPSITLEEDCPKISLPSTMYIVSYQELPDGPPRNFSTLNKTVELKGFKPYTKYSIRATASNSFTLPEKISFGEALIVRTSPGAPSKPQNISATVLHPTLVKVTWSPPVELNGKVVHYEIHWFTEGSGVRQKGEQPVNSTENLSTFLNKLNPNETYKIWIRAYSETNETYSDSDQIQITTYPEPAGLDLLNKTSQILTLVWNLGPHIQEYKINYAPITSANNWTQAVSGRLRDLDNLTVSITVPDLTPKSQYKFRFELLYEQYPEWYIWPQDSRFIFETLGDRPSRPDTPGIQFFGSNVYKVVWEAPPNNGAPIELYSLECLALRWYRTKRNVNTNRTAWSYEAPSIEEVEFDWEQVYNGSDNSWIIQGLSEEFKYAFRVSALNSYGWSDPSPESTEFDISEAERLSQKSPRNLIFIATFLPISICVIIVLCFSYVTYSRRCRKQKSIEEHVVAVQRGPDVELATLRELPRRGVHSTNILYVSSTPNLGDLAMLPHIRRHQITLTKFLGSGAFGEVFEGRAKGIEKSGLEIKVAVKTLKKGASDQEKTEFLQEAQLMSHFKHEHILQLLGVCLDNDPHFIIMELMEGGDLLTYLRNCRGAVNNSPTLGLIELLKMCLDVTKGCRYLEEMHFVHRDLACRNCLVSSGGSDNRIVKIGDFGLARDIYKNDYYRKEGEGLLPVRWMAPESLLDGVFTCQSDVWAFGVTLWEIMTLGQQPYQARSNLEVLHYVRGGGRLGKPKDCPRDLYELMLKCWQMEPDQRPTFKYCLDILDQAHRDYLRNPSTAAHSQYISTVPEFFDGISNAAYFLDSTEHHHINISNNNNLNNSGTSECEATTEHVPFLSEGDRDQEGPNNIPKYLELLYEPEDRGQLDNNGYEVPNEFINSKNVSTVDL
ncbi:hypothetical protein ABEB36_014201 [Hypothenemus hampei]|uniref:Tyrosine-protein kinase receptor n=1 Tax=Hypothenemus hampei TaxID=57062 RepID=A0ABD1E3V7_HYPHA